MPDAGQGAGRIEGRRVLVVVPAYNEAGSVGAVVSEVRAEVPQAEVVVVDDGSHDETAAEARAAGARVVRMPFNSGIGTTVQTGFKIAAEEDFDVAVQVDGDGQHRADQVIHLIRALNESGANYAVGSRFAEATGYTASAARRGGIVLFARLVSRLTGQRLTDTTSGFRAADRRTIELFADHYPYDYPEVEALVLVRRAGLRTVEVPVLMRNRETGRSSITPFRSAYYMVKVTLAVLVQFIGRQPTAEDPA
ncbi:MAG: glycosyltransferase family 2 protein [Thermoleophilia bacterium]